MEIYQVKSFLAVVEEESVTKAAKRLYTTPPSVSAHVKALEEELGIRLFERSTKGMKLTSEGISIRDKAERLLAAAVEISTQAASLRGQVLGGLEIGLNCQPSFLKASELAGRLREEHPGLELNFVASDSSRIIDAIRTETLDAGFVYGYRGLRDLELEQLADVPLSIVVPMQWRPEIEDGDWDALVRHPWVYTNLYCAFLVLIDEELQRRGLSPRSYVKSTGDDMRYDLVAKGLGIGVMESHKADRLVAEGKAFVWKGDRPLSCVLSFAYRKSRANEPAIVAATALTKELWSNCP